ncbi:hypothetical protein BVRB_6g135860 [Beta vulgaris subsp. vulgaris]|nr:hypothetical protein BVRB_6g135860 [Beta vulgaris subsp. vulgaris]
MLKSLMSSNAPQPPKACLSSNSSLFVTNFNSHKVNDYPTTS